MSFTYVASPYSGTAKEMVERFEAVEAYTAHRMKTNGEVIFSPIVHCHEIAAKFDMPTDFEFWKHYCLGMLDGSECLDVLMLPGWEKSKGVTGEIAHALKLEITVFYIDCNTFETYEEPNDSI